MPSKYMTYRTKDPEQLKAEASKFPIKPPRPWDNDPIADDPSVIGRTLEQIGGGFNKTIAAIIGLPGEISSLAFRGLGTAIKGGETTEKPLVAGGQHLATTRAARPTTTFQPAVDDRNVPDWVKRQYTSPIGSQAVRGVVKKHMPSLMPERLETVGGRVAHRIGEELGAAIPAAGLISRAATKVPIPSLMQPAKTLPGAVKKAIVAPVAEKPATAAALELASVGGSGTAAAAAKELGFDSPLEQMVAQLAGGYSPSLLAYTPIAQAFKAGKTVKGWLPSGPKDKKTALKTLQKLLGKELNWKEASKAIAEAERLGVKIEEVTGLKFKPSVAEMTSDPALLATQRGYEARAAGRNLNAIVTRHSNNVRAVEAYRLSKAPGGAEFESDPNFIVDTASGNYALVPSKDGGLVESTAKLAKTLPITDPTKIGTQIRTAYWKLRANEKKQLDEDAKNLGIDSISVPYRILKPILVDAIEQPGALDPDALPKTMVKILRTKTEIKRKGEEPEDVLITFSDIRKLRRKVSAIVRAGRAGRPGVDDTQWFEHEKLLEAIDETINQFGSLSNLDGDLATSFKVWRNAYHAVSYTHLTLPTNREV